MKVALVIGHTQKSQGAINAASGISEFTFNTKLAYDIQQALEPLHDVDLGIVYRGSYSKLPEKINDLNPDLIISLHCNAYNKEASGTEVLYYRQSTLGSEIAKLLQINLLEALGLNDRGIKPKSSEDRGGYLLRETNAPCVISEPFFIDNDNDLRVAFNNYDKLVLAYVDTIKWIFNATQKNS